MCRLCSERSRATRVFMLAVIATVAAVVSLRGVGGPRLQSYNLQYLGAFRMPPGYFGSDHGFSFGGSPMAYNPGRNSLFIGGHAFEGMIAEVSIPTPVSSAYVSALPRANVLQNFADPTNGSVWTQDFGNGVSLSGLVVFNGRLFGTVRTYYDADTLQTVSHYSRSLNLADNSATPLYTVLDASSAGFVAGWLAAVPSEWRAALHGPAITGQCCTTIISTTSWGPSAFAWNPANLGVTSPVPATPLVYYDSNHPTLGQWDDSNPAFGGTTQIGGVALIGGTSTALFVGSNGVGPFCYGNGTDNPALNGAFDEEGFGYCYDLANLDKGTHAYPYHMQFWAYDLNDLAAVAAGTKSPWQIRPYGVWPFNVPTNSGTVVGGVAYDPEHQRLYISQMNGDEDGFEERPLIHVFRIQ